MCGFMMLCTSLIESGVSGRQLAGSAIGFQVGKVGERNVKKNLVSTISNFACEIDDANC